MENGYVEHNVLQNMGSLETVNNVFFSYIIVVNNILRNNNI